MYVEDVEDIKTSHNRFLTDFLIYSIYSFIYSFIYSIIVGDVEDVYELQCRF